MVYTFHTCCTSSILLSLKHISLSRYQTIIQTLLIHIIDNFGIVSINFFSQVCESISSCSYDRAGFIKLLFACKVILLGPISSPKKREDFSASKSITFFSHTFIKSLKIISALVKIDTDVRGNGVLDSLHAHKRLFTILSQLVFCHNESSSTHYGIRHNYQRYPCFLASFSQQILAAPQHE